MQWRGRRRRYSRLFDGFGRTLFFPRDSSGKKIKLMLIFPMNLTYFCGIIFMIGPYLLFIQIQVSDFTESSTGITNQISNKQEDDDDDESVAMKSEVCE